jgi:hypothetical protein
MSEKFQKSKYCDMTFEATFPSWLILVFKLSADFGDRFVQVVG